MKKIILLLCLSSFILNTYSQNNYRDVIDVQHYTITADISNFNDYTISAGTNIIFQSTDTINEVAFDLYKYTIDSVIYNGTIISDFEYNDTLLAFAPETTIIPGQNDTCHIYYHGIPPAEPGYGWGGVHTGSTMIFNMGVAIEAVPHGFGRAWYPCIDNFTDRASYNINIITQENHRAIATGTLSEVDDYGTDKKIWKWEFLQTAPTYLISFAVGNFSLNESTYNGISENIPLEIYALPQDSAAAALTFQDVPEMLSLYEVLFGAYHWEKAGYTVVNFNSGAMEHVANIAYPGYALTADTENQTLVAHELSHQWFGNKVTCKNAGEMWLNEGWASYCEALYMEHFHGSSAYDNYVSANQRDVVNSAHDEDGQYWALSGIPDHLTYSTTVYDKGAMVVHNLRHYMGDDKFFPAVKSYLNTYAENSASSEELCEHLSNHSGIELNNFFDSWVYHGGFPQYIIDSVKYNNGAISVAVSQQSVGRAYIADGNKLEINFIDEQWNIHNNWIEFDGISGTQSFDLDFEPVMVTLDINNKCAGPVFDDVIVINSTSSYNPSGTDLTFFPQELSDSVLLHAAQMWRGPKDTAEIENGVQVLDMPWWRINYDAKGTFYTRTKFTYNTSTLNHLNLSDNDSLVLVHRTDSREDWHITNHNWYGNVGGGSLMLEELAAGDYAIALWKGGTGIKQNTGNNNFKVYPNPSKNGFYFQLPPLKNCTIHIHTMKGKEADILKPDPHTNRMFYEASHLSSGQYTVTLQKGSNIIGTCRIIKTN